VGFFGGGVFEVKNNRSPLCISPQGEKFSLLEEGLREVM